MSELSNLSWKEVDKFLIDFGCTYMRQKGSHRVYKKEGVIKLITLPEHKIISIGVISQIIRNLNIDKKYFLEKINS